MDIHEIGKELVKAIILRKRWSMNFSGIPECELCENPRPGTELVECPKGCSHHLCLRCKEEVDIRNQAMADQIKAHMRDREQAQKQEWIARQAWQSLN